jgi:hypothetical protein
MNLIERLNKKELSELLSKCWMTHDGMWFYNCVLELGIDQANKLNKAAINALSDIEIKRFKKALGITENQINTFDDFKNFFTAISDILIPEFMNVSWRFPENNIMRWEFNDKKCFAYNGMKMIGVADKYECGPIYRIECWLIGLGINYEITPKIGKCISPDAGKCSGSFKLNFN